MKRTMVKKVGSYIIFGKEDPKEFITLLTELDGMGDWEVLGEEDGFKRVKVAVKLEKVISLIPGCGSDSTPVPEIKENPAPEDDEGAQVDLPFSIYEKYPAVMSGIAKILKTTAALAKKPLDRMQILKEFMEYSQKFHPGLKFYFDHEGLEPVSTVIKTDKGLVKKTSPKKGDIMVYHQKKVGFVYYIRKRPEDEIKELRRNLPKGRIPANCRSKVIITC